MVTTLLLALTVSWWLPEKYYDMPPQLQEVVASRRATTFEVKWTVQWVAGRREGLVERYVTRGTNKELWESNLGHNRRHDGAPPPPSHHSGSPEGDAGTRNTLIYDGKVWHLSNAEQPVVGTAYPSGPLLSRLPFDFSLAGLQPRWPEALPQNTFLGLGRSELNGLESATWDIIGGRGTRTITAEFNGRRLEWLVDDERGGQPISAAFYQGDRVVYRSETELVEVGDRWFPGEIRFYRGVDESPHKVITVNEASFDEPWHMQKITPSDIGFRYGTDVAVEGDSMKWADTDLISRDEFYERWFVFGVPEDLSLSRLRAEPELTLEEYVNWHETIAGEYYRERFYKEHGQAPWLVVDREKKSDEWDEYVEAFIRKHSLNEGRAEKAGEILKRAKRLRDHYRYKSRGKIEEAREKGDEERIAHYESIPQRIFDTILVPGLRRLLPPDKRAAQAKANEASPDHP